MSVRHPSLDLNWLPRSERKGLSLPRVEFRDVVGAGGYYLMAGARFDEFEHAGERDVLVISITAVDPAATIAHEFRHMQQRYVTTLPRIECAPWMDFGDTFETWSRAFRVFYRRPWERDALQFELRHAPCESNDIVRGVLS